MGVSTACLQTGCGFNAPQGLWDESIWSQMSLRALGWDCKAGWELVWGVQPFGVILSPQSAGPK